MHKKIIIKALLTLVVMWSFSSYVWASQDQPLELYEGLSVLGKQLLEKRINIGHRKIAVTDLTLLYGEKGNLGAFIAEELTSLLASQGAELMERRLLDETLKELRLNMTDLVDPKSAKRFGHFTGTELLLLGSMTEFDDRVKINVRLIDIEILNIVSVGDVLIKKDKHVLKLMGIPYPGRLVIHTTGGSMVYLDGTPVGQANIRGDLKLDNVNPGSHGITVQREGYRTVNQNIFVEEDQELRVDISLDKLPSPGAAVFLSLIVPGGGDIYLGHDDWWIYTLGVGGSIYGAYAYSKKTEEIIWKENGNGGGKWEERGEGPVYLFVGLAATIWIYDIYHVGASAAKALDAQATESRLKLEFDPHSKGAMLVKRWTW